MDRRFSAAGWDFHKGLDLSPFHPAGKIPSFLIVSSGLPVYSSAFDKGECPIPFIVIVPLPAVIPETEVKLARFIVKFNDRSANSIRAAMHQALLNPAPRAVSGTGAVVNVNRFITAAQITGVPHLNLFTGIKLRWKHFNHLLNSNLANFLVVVDLSPQKRLDTLPERQTNLPLSPRLSFPADEAVNQTFRCHPTIILPQHLSPANTQSCS